VKYIQDTIVEINENTFSTLNGSKWTHLYSGYLLTMSDVLIILTDNDGNGNAYVDNSQFPVKNIGKYLTHKNGALNVVLESMGDGAVLEMADGSLWEIDSYDQYDTGYWLPPYEVILTNDEMYMINIKENKKIWISKIR